MKIKAGALLYTVMLSLILITLTGSLLLFHYYSIAGFQRDYIKSKLTRNAKSAILSYVSTQVQMPFYSISKIDIFGTKTDSAQVMQLQWGIYQLIKVHAYIQRDSLLKVALIGFNADSMSNTALYVASGNSKEVALSGKTFLKGECYIPNGTLQKKSVDGYTMASDNSSQISKIFKSNAKVPLLNNDILNNIKKYYFKMEILGSGLSQKFETNVSSGFINSFKEPTQIFYSSKPVKVNFTLKGNIIVISDTVIRITEDATIEDVIFVAPNIFIDNRFKGKLQAFATDSLVLGEKSALYFPSVLGIVNGGKRNNPILTLGKESLLNGVAFLDVGNNSKSLSKLLQNELATVCGLVYSGGVAEIKGVIQGTLIADRIAYTSKALSFYENILHDVTIDRSALSPYFTGTVLADGKKKFNIAKWAY